MAGKSTEPQFEIEEHIVVLAEKPSGWNKELNRVSWNGGIAKWDIREWSPDHSHCGKGITLSEDELEILLEHFRDDM